MFSRLINRFNIEKSHFLALTPDVRRILLSYAFYLAAYPLVMTFMNAYLWRTSGNLWSIITYSLGYILSLPIGFYLNGLLLRYYSPVRLYFLGAILQGITACLVVFVSSGSQLNILVLGTVYGLGAGLYYGNKNYLSLVLTRLTNLVYYNSVEQIVDLIINVVFPAIAGWFIALSTSNFVGSDNAYKLVMLSGFFLLFCSGFIVQSLNNLKITVNFLTVSNPSRAWWRLRFFNVLYNLQVGLNLTIGSVIVLLLVGNEGILGTLHAITAGISALTLYIIGRKSHVSNSWKLVAFGSLLYLVGTLTLSGIFNWIGAIVYSLVITVCWAFQWSSSYTVAMELMDKEENDPARQYAYVCDNELFFNIGRILGIALVALMTYFISQSTALRWSPLIIALLQLPLSIFIYSISASSKSSGN